MSLNRGTKLAESQVTRRTALLLLGFWAMLAPVQCSQGHPSWRYISSEVVIPRKELHHGKGVQMPGWLSYSLYFGGQRHVMHMKSKNIFWPGQLLLLTQDEQGALQMDFPFIPSDCYHLGYVEGIPFSMVTVDTCYGGLEGIMKLDDLAYEIKPLSKTRTSQPPTLSLNCLPTSSFQSAFKVLQSICSSSRIARCKQRKGNVYQMAGILTFCEQRASCDKERKVGASGLIKYHTLRVDKSPGGRQRKVGEGWNCVHLNVTFCSLCSCYNKTGPADEKYPSCTDIMTLQSRLKKDKNSSCLGRVELE